MAVNKDVFLRYQFLNRCFRNQYKHYTIEDLLAECNKALERIDKPPVSKRTIQKDIADLEMPPYSIRLDETIKSGRQRVIATPI